MKKSSPKLNPFSKPFTPAQVQAEPRLLPHRRLPEVRSENLSTPADKNTAHEIKPTIPATSDLPAESTSRKTSSAAAKGTTNPDVQDKATLPPHLRSRPKDLESNGEASSEELLRLLMPSTDVSYNKENMEPSRDTSTKGPEKKQTPNLHSQSLSDQKAMDAWFEEEEKKQRSPSRLPMSTTTSTTAGATANSSYPAVVTEALASRDDLIDLDSALVEAPNKSLKVEADPKSPVDSITSVQTTPDQTLEDSEDAYTGVISVKGRGVDTAVPISVQLDALSKRAKIKEEAFYGRRVQNQKEKDIAKFLAAYASGLETVQDKYNKVDEVQQEESNASWTAPASAHSPCSKLDHFSDSEQGYVAPPIIGTHVLGELLDRMTRAMVIRPTTATNGVDYVKSNEEWKPVVKDGRTVFVL